LVAARTSFSACSGVARKVTTDARIGSPSGERWTTCPLVSTSMFWRTIFVTGSG